MIGVVVFGLVPIAYCLIHYWSDVWEYMKLEKGTDLEDVENIMVWMVSCSQCANDRNRNSPSLLFRTFHTAFSGTDLHLSPFKYTPSRSASPGTCARPGKRGEPRKLSKDAFLPFILSHSNLNPSKLARQYQLLLLNFTPDAKFVDFLATISELSGCWSSFSNSRHKVNLKFFKIYFSSRG